MKVKGLVTFLENLGKMKEQAAMETENRRCWVCKKIHGDVDHRYRVHYCLGCDQGIERMKTEQ